MLKHCTVSTYRVLAIVLTLSYPLLTAQAKPETGAAMRLEQLEATAAELAAAMGLNQPIQVAVVPDNKRVVSVEALSSPEDGYQILIEQSFLETLDSEECVAALAHELGHVWIYSHFPFLHTEALANEIAMRAVPRKSMAALYSKLWAYNGVAGKLEDLLGPDTQQGIAAMAAHPASPNANSPQRSGKDSR